MKFLKRLFLRDYHRGENLPVAYTPSLIEQGLRAFWRWASTPWRKARQWLCGRSGHVYSGDTGWLIGSRLRDRWCVKCGKMIRIPWDESDI